MKRLRRWVFRLIISIPLIIGTAWLIENYRGSQKWEEAQERAAKLGVSLKLSDYDAPTIPDSKNLLKNPDFAREWQGEIDPRLNRWTLMKLEVPNSRGIRHHQGEPMDYLQFFPDESDPKIAIERLTAAAKDTESRLNKLTEVILSYPSQDLSQRHESLLDPEKVSHEIISLKNLVAALKDQAVLALRNSEAIALNSILDQIEAKDQQPWEQRSYQYAHLPEGGFQISSRFLKDRHSPAGQNKFHWKLPTKR